MELIALLLLAPLIWSGPSADPLLSEPSSPAYSESLTSFTVDSGRLVVEPPSDPRFTMRVVETASRQTRTPSSVTDHVAGRDLGDSDSRQIEIVVSAP